MLAWNRTVLSLLIATVALARWFAESSGTLGVVLLVVAVPGALGLLSHLDRRWQRLIETLQADRSLPSIRRLTTFLSAFVVVLGGAELVHLFLR